MLLRELHVRAGLVAIDSSERQDKTCTHYIPLDFENMYGFLLSGMIYR